MKQSGKGFKAKAEELVSEKGLPCNIDAERFVLGSILLDGSRYVDVAASLNADDFALQKHKLIYDRMADLAENGEQIDRVTLANMLNRKGELELVDGLSYLLTLDDGLPRISNLESYIRIIREKATLRRIALAAQGLLQRALIAEDDPQELLAEAESVLLGITDANGRANQVRRAIDVIQQFEGGINSFLDPSKRPKGIDTGFAKLDEITNGLRPQELLILAARPSMGKSSLAGNIAWHIAVRRLQPVVIFSLEMSAESWLTRMICAEGRVDSHRFRSGYLNESERQKLRAAAGQVAEAPLYIDDTAGLSLMDMHSKLRRIKKQNGERLGLVVVDYLQLMGGAGKNRAENRNQEVSQLSRGMKLLSKELNCPFLVLSQLSRSCETRPGDHRPQLSDIRDSGSVEQDADLVAFIYREEVYKKDREDLRGLAELIIPKQRNGPIGKIDLVFVHALTKFESRAEDFGGGMEEPPPKQHGQNWQDGEEDYVQ